MRLLAEGRASAIYDLGDGRVLRRFKGGGDPAFDMALVWVICVGIGDPRAEAFASAFVAQFEDWERGLPDAVGYGLADPNVTPEERERVRTAAYPRSIV